MIYTHRWSDGSPTDLPPGKAVCVGRNYAEHAKELNNPIPDEPLLFIKPNTAFVDLAQPIRLPKGKGNIHHEAEIAILIGHRIKDASDAQAKSAIVGVGLALDLTLRELQSELKERSHPWEKSKAFDGSCPLSAFVPIEAFDSLNNLGIRFLVNGELRQQGSTAQMLVDIVSLVQYASTFFTLLPGDVVLTGTPAGVNLLKTGDLLSMSLEHQLKVDSRVTD